MLPTLLAVALLAPPAGADNIQLDLTQCSSDGGAGCSKSSQQVAPDAAAAKPDKAASKAPRRSSARDSSGSSGSQQSGAEVHSYSLKSGKGSVSTQAGTQSDTATVDTSQAPGQDNSTSSADSQSAPDARATTTPSLPAVTTNGGAAPSVALPDLSAGATATGLSNDRALEQYVVPPFLLPIDVGAGKRYGIPWNVLAAINKAETDFGRDLSTSTAGAEGWMQFLPAEWKIYGVDANGDGYADPYNPADAIYATARYLRDHGGATDIRGAVSAFDHAKGYVDQIFTTANAYGSLPMGLLAETNTLAYGHFPLLGPASYGDDFHAAQTAGQTPEGIALHGHGGATAVATQQLTVEQILLDPTLADSLRTHGFLATADVTAAPAGSLNAQSVRPVESGLLALSQLASTLSGRLVLGPARLAERIVAAAQTASSAQSDGLPSGYAVSQRPGIGVLARDSVGDQYRYDGLALLRGEVRPGAQLTAGQPIGSLPPGADATLTFSLVAASGGPVDPRPLIDGWRLLEASGDLPAGVPGVPNPFVPVQAAAASVSSIPGGMLTSGQQTFASVFAADTGLDPGVVAAWLLAEQSGSAAAGYEARSYHNWLNIARTDSGDRGGAHGAYWNDPATAGTISAQWMAASGPLAHDYGPPAGTIRGILAAAGQPAQQQIAAIAGSGWASSGYRGGADLVALYNQVAGSQPSPVSLSSPSSYARYVFPIPANVKWSSGRVDMGWDLETGQAGVGQPLLAIGNAKILHIQNMGGFGPTWISYQLLDGPAAGRTVFIGHSGPPLVKAGDTVSAGQPVISIQGGSYGGPVGHLEIGWANADGTNTLAAPHYHEGDVTPEGTSFQAFITNLQGMLASAAFPDGLGAIKPAPVSAADERKLSDKLTEISNPRVAGKPNPAAIAVAAKNKRQPVASSGPEQGVFSLTPSAGGAALTAVATPADGSRSNEAYAIGTAGGSGHKGWAKSQTVIEAYSQGVWRFVGPPVDARGAIVNPHLRALAIVPGGRGYAVGDHGAVVTLNGSDAPRAIAAPTRLALRAVAVRLSHGRLTGLAVGLHGTLVSLGEQGARATRVGSGAPSLNAVTIDRDGTAAVAGASADGATPVLLEGRGTLRERQTDFGLPSDMPVRLTAVALRNGDLWLAGATSSSAKPGDGTEAPFAAHYTRRGFDSFCAPAATQIVELGAGHPGCSADLVTDSNQTGPATAVAITARGVVVTTPGGLQIKGANDTQSFRSLDQGQGPGSLPSSAANAPASLAIPPAGEGWVIGQDGRMTHIVPAQLRAALPLSPRAARIPLSGTTSPAAVAVTPDGGRALAVGPGGSATFDGSKWAASSAPGFGVRAAAMAGDRQAWAITDSGGLASYADGRWSLLGASAAQQRDAAAARAALGGAPLAQPQSGDVNGGLRSVAFRSPAEGYAVGSGGLIARFDHGGWTQDLSPVRKELTSVATGPGGVVAVGRHGTLLEREGNRWTASPTAAALVHGLDFTAAGALNDGTMLAAAGGQIIARDRAGGSWSTARLAPLSTPATKLSGYRDSSGTLHVLALVGDGDGKALVDGDATGWRPVDGGDGMRISDFAVDGAGVMTAVGVANGGPQAAQFGLGNGAAIPALGALAARDAKAKGSAR